MTEAEAIQAHIDALESYRDRLLSKPCAEAPPVYFRLLDMLVNSANDEIGRLKAELRAIESSATLVDIGNKLSLSEM